MLTITNFGGMLQPMSGMAMQSIAISSLSTESVKKQLKAAGIDINSKQYKAVINEMMKVPDAMKGYTNIQAIKNLMRNYDKDGDYIDPNTGLAGLLVTDKNRAARHTLISIPESSREEMFESTKKEFLRENGICNGDTTNRSEVYTNLYRKMKKNDRLPAGYTLEQYERAYRKAFVDAAKAADPSWEIGRPIPKGALDNITREDVDAALKQSGNKLVWNSVDYSV